MLNTANSIIAKIPRSSHPVGAGDRIRDAAATSGRSSPGILERGPSQKSDEGHKVIMNDRDEGRPSGIAGQSLDKIKKALEEINRNELEFSVHEKTGKTVIKVVDRDTGEVIREIPPEELLDIAARIDEMVGMLFDKRI